MGMIYYTYCPKTFVAQGFVMSEKQPPNSTTWPPPVQREGQQIYFNGQGWMHGRPLEQLTPKLLSEAALCKLKRELRNAINALSSGDAAEEVATYARQQADAEEYLRTGELTPFLATLSTAQGIGVDELVRKILIKARAYNEAVAFALGTYKRKAAELKSNPPTLTQELLQEPRLLIP